MRLRPSTQRAIAPSLPTPCDAGNPAAYIRDLSKSELAEAEGHAEETADVAAEHAAEFLPFTTAYADAERLGVEDEVRVESCPSHCGLVRPLCHLPHRYPITAAAIPLQRIRAINAQQAAYEAALKASGPAVALPSGAQKLA